MIENQPYRASEFFDRLFFSVWTCSMFFLAVRLGMGLDMAGASKGEVGSAFGCKMDQQ